jgi:hypothetical protein
VKQTSTKLTTQVTEYLWRVEVSWTLDAFQGVGDVQQSVEVLTSRTFGVELRSKVKMPPCSQSSTGKLVQLSLSWLLTHLAANAGVDGAGGHQAFFAIDRSHSKCVTPRRNEDVAEALHFSEAAAAFSLGVCAELLSVLSDLEHPTPDLTPLDSSGVLLPFALFSKTIIVGEQPASGGAALSLLPVARDAQSLLDRAALNEMLNETARGLQERCATLCASLLGADERGACLSAAEARLLVAFHWLRRVAQAHADSVDAIEDMLRRQVIAAVGKEVAPADFDRYMAWQLAARLFRPAFAPLPFCFAVRRSGGHSPEGLITLTSGESEPIFTTACSMGDAALMSFPLSASARVSFGGDRHIHGWMSQRFSDSAPPSLTLVASARQFCSFVVLVGRMNAADTFEPAAACIIKDKDVLRMPLDVACLPAPKTFRDAIARRARAASCGRARRSDAWRAREPFAA